MFSFILIGCPPDDGTTTYETIKSVKASLFSFDKNGIYPYFDKIPDDKKTERFKRLYARMIEKHKDE